MLKKLGPQVGKFITISHQLHKLIYSYKALKTLFINTWDITKTI